VSLPGFDDARGLAEWRPPLGVVSIYLRLDPGDRGGAWRTELHNGLAAVLEGQEELDHRARLALRATAERVRGRFANHERDLPRGEVGFLEVSAEPAGQRWWSTHLSPEATVVRFAERPLLAPLLCLVERGTPRGVALASAERVRLLESVPGSLEELHRWELSLFSGDWRERKAPRVADPARAQAVSAAGRDQYDQRLEDSRHRFLGECGRLSASIAAERGWRQLLAFGAPEHVRDLRHGIPASTLAVEVGGGADLISDPLTRLEEPVAKAVERLDTERERGLVERALDEARGGIRGAAGPQETAAALGEGRVEHLVLDAALAAAGAGPGPRDGAEQKDGAPDPEGLVRLALEGGAGVATVSGPAAELLAPVDGVAALLRY
jgi:Bacterial archaeo-eukaryotic release factor family 10